ncbi:hypothetical protein FRZ67_00295 [Panacibacter ginsenosidivorans]|uniref:Uncharacterized protein n=1 Tax=Panacibacter ginsenosidivorans TaxID=1813871 RepID=A0A5B8V5E8_9BACT|nr:hypothetical protein [Panacibacter ginsenosidivorans]QEC65816.1 hypothetical protein FRZ67_00295 [Panacibacter ginsenosidivorans]
MQKKLSIAFFISSVLLIAYAYIARAVNLFFFWESDSIGICILFIVALSYLFRSIKKRKIENKNSIVSIYLSILTLFVFLLYVILLFTLGGSNAAKACKDYCIEDKRLNSEIGSIIGFGFNVTGSRSANHINESKESGKGSLTLIVKGEKKFKDISFKVSKEPFEEWQIIYADSLG